jgi:hypothetical protein
VPAIGSYQSDIGGRLSDEAARQQKDYAHRALNYSQHNWRRIAQFITVRDYEYLLNISG